VKTADDTSSGSAAPLTVSLRNSTSGLDRALAVLSFIAERSPEPVGVSTVARELDLPKAVAHRILKELTGNKFLRFDESIKQYSLGAGALTIGLAAMRGVDVPAVARRHMRTLVEATSETATLSVRQGWSRVYIDQVLSPHEIRMTVSLGSLHPLFAGSSSKAILAALGDDEIADYLSQVKLSAVTDSTITSTEQLRVDLDQVRRKGYAVSIGERQAGAASTAAAIRLASGEVFGSLSICGPAGRFSAAQLRAYGELVGRTAAEVSAEVGYSDNGALNTEVTAS
jgi:DNA-binding IclR family transcriptional regulator